MRRTKKIRASKDEQLQEDTLPLTQRPEFIIGMTFLGMYVVFIICVLIFYFIHRKGDKTGEVTDITHLATPSGNVEAVRGAMAGVWGAPQ